MNTITLNGLWSFQTDPCHQGVRDGYYRPDYPFIDEVQVPGSWRLSEKYRHYHGAAWYKRRFLVDGQAVGAGRRYQLFFGGIFRYADVYVNGSLVGHHDGYQSSFRIDATGLVVAGENWVAVMADDIQDESFDMMGGAACMEVQQVHLAGIYQPVRLEIRASLHVSDAYAALEPGRQAINLAMTVENATGTPVEAGLAIRLLARRDSRLIVEDSHSLFIAGDSAQLTKSYPAGLFEWWSPEDPNLYHIEITVTGLGQSDTFTQRTGFKHLAARGKYFDLNGNPFFLRGYGDDFVYPMTSLPDAIDSRFYHRQIQAAKKYGFNAVRHHSHFPFETYLDAADELGLLVQPELAMANIEPGAFRPENEKLFLAEWRALIRENRRHPCIMAWCGGNEEEWGYPFADKIYRIAKQLDPYRLATITDGTFTAREVEAVHDYASLCYAESTDTLPLDEFDDLYRRDDCGKPQIVHEMGNYTTLPPIGDLPKYDGAVVFPDRLQQYADLVRRQNKEALYAQCFDNANTLQRICHKINMERARLSPFVAGYHIWTFTDYFDTTQGIVNPFYEDKAFSPETFRQINAASVLLWDTDRYVFRAGEAVSLDIRLSKFQPDDMPEASLQLSLSTGQTLSATLPCTGCGLIPAVRWDVALDDCHEAAKITLYASLQYGQNELHNEWDLWVYPRLAADNRKELFINYLLRYLVEDFGCRFRHFTIPMPLDDRNLILTGVIYNGMLDAVRNGAAMFLLAGEDTFRATAGGNAFRSAWWMQQRYFYLNRSSNLQASNVMARHPAIAGIPHGSCWELNLYHLVENRHAIRIDTLGLSVEPIIFGVDPELEKLAYLFEFKYGRGKILVSTLNFDRANLKYPEVDYTFRSLVNYCMSDRFNPGPAVAEADLAAALQAAPA